MRRFVERRWKGWQRGDWRRSPAADGPLLDAAPPSASILRKSVIPLPVAISFVGVLLVSPLVLLAVPTSSPSGYLPFNSRYLKAPAGAGVPRPVFQAAASPLTGVFRDGETPRSWKQGGGDRKHAEPAYAFPRAAAEPRRGAEFPLGGLAQPDPDSPSGEEEFHAPDLQRTNPFANEGRALGVGAAPAFGGGPEANALRDAAASTTDMGTLGAARSAVAASASSGPRRAQAIGRRGVGLEGRGAAAIPGGSRRTAPGGGADIPRIAWPSARLGEPIAQSPSLAVPLRDGIAPGSRLGASSTSSGSGGGPASGQGGGGGGSAQRRDGGPVVSVSPVIFEQGEEFTVSLASAIPNSTVAVFCLGPGGTSCGDAQPGTADAQGRWSRTYPGSWTVGWSTGTYSGWLTAADVPTQIVAFEVRKKQAD